MLTKIIGCAIITLCASKIGFDEAGKYTKRVKEIREFQMALVSLKGEISFCRTPLSEALVKTGQRLKTSVAEIFTSAGVNLKSGVKSAKEVWDGALYATQNKLSLKNDEMYVLSSFGGLLGISDAAGQLDNIELTTAKLIMCEKQALEDEKRLSKLYRSMGVIGGIFLSILLL